ARRHGHARHAGELFDRLGEAHPRLLGEEPEVVACHPAAEAVVDALPVVRVEAWRLLAVERAARPEISPPRLRLPLVPDHMLADHLMNGQPLPDLVEKAVGKAHGVDISGAAGPDGKRLLYTFRGTVGFTTG